MADIEEFMADVERIAGEKDGPSSSMLDTLEFDVLCKTVDEIGKELSSVKSTIEEEAWKTRALVIGLFVTAFLIIPFLDHVFSITVSCLRCAPCCGSAGST